MLQNALKGHITPKRVTRAWLAAPTVLGPDDSMNTEDSSSGGTADTSVRLGGSRPVRSEDIVWGQPEVQSPCGCHLQAVVVNRESDGAAAPSRTRRGRSRTLPDSRPIPAAGLPAPTAGHCLRNRITSLRHLRDHDRLRPRGRECDRQ